MRRFSSRFLILFALIFGISACVRIISDSNDAELTPVADAIFVNFYESLGGEEILGPIISSVFSDGETQYQYAENGFMVYQPEADGTGTYYLEALGLKMGIAERVENPGEVNVTDHPIYPGFLELYTALGGEEIVGSPLVDAKYNPDKNRIEQYFENLGFFLDVGELEESVRLLAYGSWMCKQDCRSTPLLNNVIDLPDVTVDLVSKIEIPLNNYFLPVVTRDISIAPALFLATQANKIHMPVLFNLHPIKPLFDQMITQIGIDLTGYALTGIYENQDGQLEQVFENVVLRLDPAGEGTVDLLPVPMQVNIVPDEPEQQGSREGMTFYSISGDQGFYVPAQFLHYLNLHAGDSVYGRPITRYQPLNDQVTWQCFEKICLEEHQNTPEGLIIRPVALGYQYRSKYPTQSGELPQASDQSNQISIQFWEKYPRLASQQPQEILVSILRNFQPLSGAQLVVSLAVPNQELITHQFPPTDENGNTHIKIEPISADVGTVVPYQICLIAELSDSVCVNDSFIVWDNE